MKKSIILFALLAMVAACNQVREKTAKEILERPKIRSEIYSEILSNHQYFDEFMSKMSPDSLRTSNCTFNVPVMRWAWDSDRMDSLFISDEVVLHRAVNRMMRRMESDSMACQMMCSGMMGNYHTKNQMMKHACGNKEMNDKKKEHTHHQ